MTTELIDQLLSVPEVQDYIFFCRSLSQSDLARCTQVSKTWHRVVTPFVWEALVGSEKQMSLVTQQGLYANAEWIRDVILTQWKILDWLVETEKCTRLSRLELKLSRSYFITTTESRGDGQVGDSALIKLIQNNPQLTSFTCHTKDRHTATFNGSIAKTLADSCWNHLQSLELLSVALENSDLVQVLNRCKKLQVLDIRSCSFMADYLDEFDEQLPNLQRLTFAGNFVFVNDHSRIQVSRARDWLKLLGATKDSPKFEYLNLESGSLMGNELSEFMNSHGGSSLTSITQLSLMGIVNSNGDLAKILSLVQPLKVLRLSDTDLVGQALEVVRLRHQSTLQELVVWFTKEGEQPRGLLTTLQLPKLEILIVDCEALLFGMFVPQLYAAGNEITAQRSTQNDVEHYASGVDDNYVVSALGGLSLSEGGSTPEIPRSRDWTCHELEFLSIHITFSQRLEREALRNTFNNETVWSPEELYVKGFLLMMEQILKLSKLECLNIAVLSDQDLDQTSDSWKELDGCWIRVFTECKKLKEFNIDWSTSAPAWLMANFGEWHWRTYPAKTT